MPMCPGQARRNGLFDESHLPSAEEKIRLYLKGKELLLNNGYTDIGMDHFALPTDELYQSLENEKIASQFYGLYHAAYRTFTGTWCFQYQRYRKCFCTKSKTIHDYYTAINAGNLAVKRGYVLSEEDIAFRKYILDISCNGETFFNEEDLPVLEQYSFPILSELATDGLVEWNRLGVKLTEKGHYFIRNVCSAFDLYLQKTIAEKKIFSNAI